MTIRFNRNGWFIRDDVSINSVSNADNAIFTLYIQCVETPVRHDSTRTHTHTQNHAHLMHKHQSAWLLHHNIAKTPYACRMKFLGKYKRNTDSIQFRLNIVRGRHRTAHCTIDAVTNSIHNAMAEIYEFLGWNNHVIVLFVGIVHITCELCVSLFFSLSLSMCVCVHAHGL